MQELQTGPIIGAVQLEDGRFIDVTPDAILLEESDIEEVCHLIAMRHVREGHPRMVEVDDDEGSLTYGQMIQRPFVYTPPERFAQDAGEEPVGTPRED